VAQWYCTSLERASFFRKERTSEERNYISSKLGPSGHPGSIPGSGVFYKFLLK